MLIIITTKKLQDIQHKKKETIILQLKWIGSMLASKRQQVTNSKYQIANIKCINTTFKFHLLIA